MYSGKEYIAGLTEEPMQLLECYETELANDPFLDNNSQLWDTLMGSLGNERRKAWQDLIPNTNMSQNSKKAWSNITPNQVGSQQPTGDEQKGAALKENINPHSFQVTNRTCQYQPSPSPWKSLKQDFAL
ncbi:Rab3 GTPase-activating protein regulatory subunit [Dissostichus eleginoides]|uniref:Rab3 GTPase-activating protein regulatory subunit n=1 Tax=Dissostichus eleginoides TaxID=100907 RepID=A0AAD9CS43_DISEL|nr:Rab3 GTPase-activating protein regulatory subunit [Dissostichus eleginoides]